MTTELRRLGKRGAYRLGQLRAQGVKVAVPPPPRRMSFARDHRRGPAGLWLLALLGGAAAIAAAVAIGWWFVPFVAGLAAGLANRVGGWHTKTAVLAVAIAALAGWGAPLCWQLARHRPDGAAGPKIAALHGLPAYSAAGIMVALLIAVGQAVVGYWLGRAVTPRPDPHDVPLRPL